MKLFKWLMHSYLLDQRANTIYIIHFLNNMHQILHKNHNFFFRFSNSRIILKKKSTKGGWNKSYYNNHEIQARVIHLCRCVSSKSIIHTISKKKSPLDACLQLQIDPFFRTQTLISHSYTINNGTPT